MREKELINILQIIQQEPAGPSFLSVLLVSHRF